MEDIEVKQQNNDQEDNVNGITDEFDDDSQEKEVFNCLESKMGGEETDILECIKKVYIAYFEKIDDDFAKDREELVKHYEPIAGQVQDALRSDGLGQWNVAVGERFSSALGLMKSERFAIYQTGSFSVAVIEFK